MGRTGTSWRPALLPQTVAQALRITLASRDSATTVQQQLVGVLRSQKILLVLDNCEHVVDAVSRLAAAIGAEALGVHTLATSQEQLGVHGEHVFPLASLSVPASGETPHVETHGAVALFVERTRAVSPHFCLTAENAAAVSDICHHLDGLPLAIELAAARVRLLGVQGLRERLGDRFKVLVGGARTALPCHQTLRATIDWSHALLNAEEQAVLRRLGVFVGGFSLTLAQEVAADEEAVSVLEQQQAQLLLAPGEAGALSACRSNLSVMLNCLGRHSEAIALAQSALQHRGASAASSYVLFQFLHAQVALNRIVDARRTLRDAVPIWRRDALLLFGGFAVAELLASCGRQADAARVEAAATAYMRRTGARLQKVQQLARGHVFRALDAAGVARADVERWRHEGEGLDEDQVAATCESVVASP